MLQVHHSYQDDFGFICIIFKQSTAMKWNIFSTIYTYLFSNVQIINIFKFHVYAAATAVLHYGKRL